MVNRRFAQRVAHLDQLTNRHALPLRVTHVHLQQRIQAALLIRRQLQRHGIGVLAVVTQIRRRFARQTSMQRANDALLRNPQQRGFTTIHGQHGSRRTGRCAVIHIDHAFGFGKHLAHLFRHLRAPRVIRPVHLGHDRREHRWPGWYFHHLHIRTVTRPDFLQFRPQAGGDLMAFFRAMVFILQIHDQFADLAATAQVILTHQTIEINRRGSARVGLVIGHFRHRSQIRAQIVQHRRSVFQRRTRRHIDHDLKFRFIVKRQHFQLHQTQHRQNHRQRNQTENPQTEFKAVLRTVFHIQQRVEYFFKPRAQFARQSRMMRRFFV